MRQRTTPGVTKLTEVESDDTDFEEGAANETVSSEITSAVPSGTDATPPVIDTFTKNMSSRWRNWTVRFIFGLLMILCYLYLLYLGPLALIIMIFPIQMKCFSEIINIGYVVYKSQNLPWFRTLSWYFLLTTNYYIFGKTTIDRFGLLLHKDNFMRPLVTYHKFISFIMYLAGFVAFTFSLRRRYYLRQFTLFGYTHVTLLIVAIGANFIIKDIFEGVFWFFISTTLIICNDIWAYFFGFFIGKTPLIKLSPKKTWEGYIGGGLATLVYAAVASYAFAPYEQMVCPVEYNIKRENILSPSSTCTRNPVFVLYEYSLPESIKTLTSALGWPMQTVEVYPIVFHALILATFASLIGPFGGFFASGLKRAYKIKDFGDIFPGHGGFMDRFDCQFLMSAFTYIYVSTFIRVPNTQKMVATILGLQPDNQLLVMNKLCDILQAKGLTDCSSLSR